MNKAQFKVGSVYLDASGRVTRVVGPHLGVGRSDGTAWVQVFEDERWWGDGYRHLSDGSDPSGLVLLGGGVRTLIPGELVLRDGQWVAVEEAKEEHGEGLYIASLPACPYATMESRDGGFSWGYVTEPQPDPYAAMIARDERCIGIARMFASNAPAPVAPTSTAKPALSALTLSPDLSEAKHQVNAQHAMAADRFA